MPSADDYERLERALIDEAVGSEGEAEVQYQRVARNSFDMQGNHTVQTQEARPRRANIALAERLLSERIGGPQDYC